MEHKAAHADAQVANKGDQKDGVMAVLQDVSDSLDGQVDEEGICESVDDFGRVLRGIVVLFLNQSRISCEGHRTSVPPRTSQA